MYGKNMSEEAKMKRDVVLVVVLALVLTLIPLVRPIESATPFGQYDKVTVIAQLDRLAKVAESKPVDTVNARCSNALMKECLAMPASIYIRLDGRLSDYSLDDSTRLLFFKTDVLLFKVNISLNK